MEAGCSQASCVGYQKPWALGVCCSSSCVEVFYRIAYVYELKCAHNMSSRTRKCTCTVITV